ncbi:MAG: pyridoxal phosphate-dependent aminotransferase [Candidatus Omnitrophica bacterium]|nr:pyridoxal phosphate-dependent aminotransferase [Candidatus Omnitrophota bacterium]
MKIDSRLSERIRKVNPSPTLSITAKAKKLVQEGIDVVSFAAGEPDFDTPDVIKKAAKDAIDAGFTKYTPTTGIPELKKLIAAKFLKDNALTYDERQIIVSCGAKHSIFNALFVLVNPNDEVLIPSPYWVSYPEMAYLCGGIPKFVKTDPANSFKMTADDLKKNCSAKTKVLILNSPSNPAGCVYSREELAKIAEICVARKIRCISDEIYEKIIFDREKHVSIASLGKQICDLTVTVNGLSKSHSMTGWRIGYLGAPQDIAQAISNFQDHSTSNPTSISQKAAVAALAMPDAFSRMMSEEFEKRRDYIVKRIQGMPKFSCVVPRGAFYIFCDIRRTRADSLSFCGRLLDELSIAAIPGIAFGNDGFVRFSFATSMEHISKGMDRLEGWLKKL